MTDLRCASASSALRLLSRPGGGPQLGLDKRLARASERGASAHASWSTRGRPGPLAAATIQAPRGLETSAVALAG